MAVVKRQIQGAEGEILMIGIFESADALRQLAESHAQACEKTGIDIEDAAKHTEVEFEPACCNEESFNQSIWLFTGPYRRRT